VFGVLTKIDKN